MKHKIKSGKQLISFSIILFIFLNLISISGCGDGGSVTGPKEEEKEPPIVDTIENTDDLMKLVDGISDKWQEILPPPNTPLDERHYIQELKTFAKAISTQSTVESVVVYKILGQAQITLENGLVLIVLNRPEVYMDKRENSKSILSNKKSALPNLTGSGKAVAAYVDVGEPTRDKVKEFLEEKGYTVQTGNTISAMKNYKDLGALYLDTHGLVFNEARVPKPHQLHWTDNQFYGLLTSTKITKDKLYNFRNGINNTRLIISLVGDSVLFAITNLFIEKYWSFKDAIVMIHACNFGSAPFMKLNELDGVYVYCKGSSCGDLGPEWRQPGPMREAIIGAGAELLVSFDNFTNTEYASSSILFFFDRMLGINRQEKIDPPLRPFDISEVKKAMDDEGLLTFIKPKEALFGVPIDTEFKVVNLTFQGNEDEAMLAPSIKNFELIDDAAQSEGKMTLYGRFGTTRGKVKVNGKEVTVESWAKEQIVARVPYADYAGPIRVVAPDEVKSNKVPLTEWKGTVKITFAPVDTPPLRATVKMDLVFRGDIHAYRSHLDSDPEHSKIEAYTTPASKGVLKGSGTYSNNGTPVTWFGKDEMRLQTKKEMDFKIILESSFGATLKLFPNEEEAKLCFGVMGYVNAKGGTRTQKIPIVFFWADLYDTIDRTWGCMELTLNEDYTISGTSNSAEITDDEGETVATIQLEISKFIPENPPDEPLDTGIF